MDVIFIAVKFSTRAAGGRVYRVTGQDFETMKMAIKSLRGKFDGDLKVWWMGNTERLALKTMLSVEADDFDVRFFSQDYGRIKIDIAITMRIDRRIMFVATKWVDEPTGAEPSEIMGDVVAEFVAAYNQSDEALREYVKNNEILFGNVVEAGAYPLDIIAD